MMQQAKYQVPYETSDLNGMLSVIISSVTTMDIKNSPIVKHAINNDKSLLPGIIAYSCKEAMVMAKRECGDFIDFAKEWIQSSKQLCEEENIPWEQIRAATGDSIDNYMS